MSQHLYVDFRDGFGQRDYTNYLTEFSQFITHDINKPALMAFTLCPVGDTSEWRIPERGAMIRYEDTLWLSRTPGVNDGIIFTGYITDVPTLTQLGELGLWGYTCAVTSEDYLANLHTMPAVTYINKTRGFIIKDLLHRMFQGSHEFPYHLESISDGGEERFFQVDVTQKFTDLVALFAKADSFTYYVIDGHWVYAPQDVFMEASPDPKVHLVIDAQDPRYTTDSLKLKKIDSVVANDVTIVGNDEGGSIVKEVFTSDGYSGTLQLSLEPFGTIENVLIDDDMASDTINSTFWIKQDVANYIRPFEGSLNIIGGSRTGKTTSIEFLRSIQGLDLSGVLGFRDAEIAFPPIPSGVGILGGVYATAEDEISEADLIMGWKMDANTMTLTPMGPNGAETAMAVQLNPLWSYELTKWIYVSAAARASGQYYSFTDGFRQTFGRPTPEPSSATLLWGLTTINTDDPANVTKTYQWLGSGVYQLSNSFALYYPIASYDLHIVMNNCEVFKPQQLSVAVNGANVLVGSALDGGQCVVTVDMAGAGALINWYADKLAINTTQTRAAVTIPPQGSYVLVTYWQKEKAIARVINTASVALEKELFHDDGIRQLTINAGDIQPIPNTSEECLALGQAYLVDRSVARWDGTYAVDVCEGAPTELNYWIYPGDLIPVDIALPDGTRIQQRLLISSVKSEASGASCYTVTLTFGALSRVTEALRQLIVKRQTSLDDLSYKLLPVVVPETMDEPTLPADPTDWVITYLSTTLFQVSMTATYGSLPAGVVGYEVRKSDTGWGTGGETALFPQFSSVYNFTRTKRDEQYYIRPYNANGEFSRRSAFVRVVHPLPNTILLDKTTGSILGTALDKFSITVPTPINPDFGGIVLNYIKMTSNFDGTTTNVRQFIYAGDGITNTSAAGVIVTVNNGSFTVTGPLTAGTLSASFDVTAYDITQAVGKVYTFAIYANSFMTILPTGIQTYWSSPYWVIVVDMSLLVEAGNHASGIRVWDENYNLLFDGGYDGLHYYIPNEVGGDVTSSTRYITFVLNRYIPKVVTFYDPITGHTTTTIVEPTSDPRAARTFTVAAYSLEVTDAATPHPNLLLPAMQGPYYYAFIAGENTNQPPLSYQLGYLEPSGLPPVPPVVTPVIGTPIDIPLAPSTPSSLNPIDGAAGVSTTPSFTWAAPGAVSYSVQLSTVNPPTTVVASGLALALYQSSILLNSTVYYWRIIATNATGSTFGPVSSFTTVPASPVAPTAPVGPSPMTGASNVIITPNLTWASIGATSYSVQLDTTATPTVIVATGLSSPGYQSTALLNSTTYFWRVTATNAAGSTVGPIWSFTTAAAAQQVPSAPATPSPATAATGVSITPTLTWVSTGATTYSIQMGVATPPTTVLASGLIAASYQPATLAYSTRYYWRIVATNSVGSTTGPIWSFTTVPAPVVAPTAPTTPSPATAAIDVSAIPLLTWVSNGATYDVLLGQTTPPTVAVASGLTVASYQSATLSDSTLYYWRVVARNSAGSTTGPIWSFTTAAPALPGALPVPWLHQDIGAVGLAGSATYQLGGTGGSGVDPYLPIVPGAPHTPGMHTRAAYGGGVAPIVYRVTSLADNGPGTLRAATEGVGLPPRIVIFEVSGYIELESDLIIVSNYLTIAGQTAPSPGITVRMVPSAATEAMIIINAHDVLFQHFAVRPGSTTCNSGILCYGSFETGAYERRFYNVVMDHMSLSWAQDEGFFVGQTDANGGNVNFTAWRCIAAEGLFRAPGGDACTGGGQANGHGFLLQGTQMEIIQSLMACNFERNPMAAGGISLTNLNNIIYGWQGEWGLFVFNFNLVPGPYFVTAVGNRYIVGPDSFNSSAGGAVMFWLGAPTSNNDGDIVVDFGVEDPGNQIYRLDNTVDNWSGINIIPTYNLGSYDPSVTTVPSQAPIPSGYVPIQSTALESYLLPLLGARPWDRDAVDTRIINNVINRTGGFITQPSDVGGYPTLAVNTRALATPSNPHVVTASGYTNMEVWLHSFTNDTTSSVVGEDTFYVTGSGADIFGLADAFQYAYQPMTGDTTIIAHVSSLQNTSVDAKAGVMMRSALTPSVRHVMLNCDTDGSIEMITRGSDGQTATLVAQGVPAPTWLQLARVGSTMTGSVSTDFVTWTVIGSVAVPGLAYVGLCVTSAVAGTPNLSSFGSVLVTTGSGTVIISNPPTASISASPTSVAFGQSSTLSWNTLLATSVSISDGVGTVSISGSLSVTPAVTTTYTLTATGAGGTTISTATVTVTGGGTTPPGQPSGPGTANVFYSGWEQATGTAATCNADINDPLTDRFLWNGDYGPGNNAVCSANPPIVRLDTAITHGGSTKSMRVHYKIGDGANGPDFRISRLFGQEYHEIWVSWYQYWDPNWVWAGADHKMLIAGSNNPISQDTYFNVRGNSGGGQVGRFIVANNTEDAFFHDAGTAGDLHPGQWYHFEGHIVSGVHGYVEAKVNGVLLNLVWEVGPGSTDPYNQNTGASLGYIKLDTTYNDFAYFEAHIGALGSSNTYYDDVSVGTTGWIGGS